MSKKVLLERGERYRWHTKNGMSLKGFVFDADNELCSIEQVLHQFENATSLQEIEGVLSGLDGSFSTINETPEGIILVADFMNAFPIFYTWKDGSWLVSDNSYKLLEILGQKKCNQNAFAEFEGAGFVLGNQTLVQDIFKTQAAEIVILKPDGSRNSKVYSRWLPHTFFEMDRQELKGKLAHLLEWASEKFVKSLKHRHVVVSLSGGYDSRLIACMLKNNGYQNVTCLTYGRPSQESFLAEKVARQLGYKWVFVNYEEIDIEGYLESQTFNDYYNHAANLYSMPYIQDYFAVKHLKENNLVADDSLFVHGHSGDFLGGSYMNKTARTKTPKSELPRYIFEKYYNFGSYFSQGKKQVIKRLEDWFSENHVEELTQHPETNFWVEEWDIKEKLSKFIFQSVQVFSFFGYGFRLPLWGKPLRDFFRQVPVEYRKNKNLYDEVLIENFFKPNGVYFETSEINLTPVFSKLGQVKKYLKSLAPQPLLDKLIVKNDVICYEKLTAPMKKQIEGISNFKTKKTFCFNNIICKWYVETINQKLQCK